MAKNTNQSSFSPVTFALAKSDAKKRYYNKDEIDEMFEDSGGGTPTQSATAEEINAIINGFYS